MSGLLRRKRLTKLSLTQSLYNSIIAHACAFPHAEVCGFVAGKNATCLSAYPVGNVSPTPECAYFMDPHGQISAMSAIDLRGETLLGIYHSHPNTPARPSRRDIDGAAHSHIAYLIVSLIDKRYPSMAAFSLSGSEFTPLRLIFTPT
jgi:proteasome lid subunit RPN8/RPN11